MDKISKKLNLVLSGGGIKGIAYGGVFEASWQKGYRFNQIVGVSAGAIAAAFIAAGYSYGELKRVLQEFDFEKVKISEIPKRVYAVQQYSEFCRKKGFSGDTSIKTFLSREHNDARFDFHNFGADFNDNRNNFFKNLVTYSKEGCLYDGDYLEEWISQTLQKKGVRTFGDLRISPHNKTKSIFKLKSSSDVYKIKVTAVDATRGKVIVLPQDISYYGIEPDDLQVSKAVRMSASVPFVFKPVELEKRSFGIKKIHHIVDGGVFDNFPFWCVDGTLTDKIDTLGFRLDGEEIRNRALDEFSERDIVTSGLGILIKLISSVHDIGIPKTTAAPKFVVQIDTSKVSFLDFGLTKEDKEYLYNQGKTAAMDFFNG